MSVFQAPWYTPAVQKLLDLSLEEDAGRGDVTSASVIDDGQEAEADIIAKERLVVCGLGIAEAVFTRFDWRTRLRARVADGDPVTPGTLVATVRGPAQSLLAGERVALNFMQHLSGIATLTQTFVAAAEGAKVRITDTRKTTPGVRALEKYAVRVGGGHGHRADLSSGILIKDNHVALVGSVREAVRRARANAPHGLRVEVEVDSMTQLDEALEAGAEVVLLDNFATRDIIEGGQARARPGAAHADRNLGGRDAGPHARAGKDRRRHHLGRLADPFGAGGRSVAGSATRDWRAHRRRGPLSRGDRTDPDREPALTSSPEDGTDRGPAAGRMPRSGSPIVGQPPRHGWLGTTSHPCRFVCVDE